MPNGDRTGPMGASSRGGRSAGYCRGMHPPGCYHAQPPGGRPMGMMRRRKGWRGVASGNRGMRRGPCGGGWPGRRDYSPNPKTSQSLPPDLEEESLRRRSLALQTELEAIHQQLQDLKTQEAAS